MLRTTLLNSRYTLYHDRDFSSLERDIIKDGVVDVDSDGGDLQVSEVAGQLKVGVQKGAAYVRCTVSGYWKQNPADPSGDSIWEAYPETYEHIVRVELDGNTQLDVDPNTSGSPRTDFVVLTVDTAVEPNAVGSNVSSISILKNQSAGDPVATGQYKLAELTVADSATELASGDIEDTRYWIELSPATFDPTTGHDHDGVNSKKVKAQNVTATAHGAVSGLNVQTQLKQLEDQKTDKGHTHILANITDVTVTKDQLNRNLPTNVQKDALVGAGTPAASNPYATKDYVDSQIAAGQSGSSRQVLIFVKDVLKATYEQKKDQATLLFYDEDEITEGSQQLSVFDDDFDTYGDYWKKLCNFEDESGETYTNGSFNTNTDYIKQGTQSRTVTLSPDSTSAISVDFATGKDFSGFSGSDKLVFWVYVTAQANVDTADLQLGTGGTPSSNYFQANILSQITGDGWNRIEVNVSAFSNNGSPDWSNVTRVLFEFSTNSGGSCTFYVDHMQFQDSKNPTGGVWADNGGEWDMQEINSEIFIVNGEWTGTDGKIILTEENQSRKYKDCAFTCKFRYHTDQKKFGVLARYVDDDNYYMVRFGNADGGDNHIALYKNVASSLSQVGSTVDYTFAADTDYWIRFTLQGSTITVEISTDGTLFTTVLTATDSDLTEGKIGLYTYASDGYGGFSDVNIKQIANTEQKAYGGKVVRINTHKGWGDEMDGYQTEYKAIYKGDEGTLTNSTLDEDTDHYSLYTGGAKITSSSGTEVVAEETPDTALDLSVFSDLIDVVSTDYIGAFAFVDDATKLDHLKIQFFTSTGNYYEKTISGLSTGLNRFYDTVADYAATGSPDWSNITKVIIKVKATAGNSVNVTLNGLRLWKTAGIIIDTYNLSGGTWEVDDLSNERYIVQTDRAVGEYRAVAISGANYDQQFDNPTFQLRIKGEGGLMFRYTDADNFYALMYKDGRVSLKKKVSGVYETIGEEVLVAPTGYFTLKGKADGENFEFWLALDNEVFALIDQVTDSAMSAGTFGLVAFGNGLTQFDELEIIEKDDGADPYEIIYYDENDVPVSIVRKP